MDCDDWAEMGIGISDCRGGTPIYSWAIGGEIFELPDHVGMEMGGDINDDSMVQYILIGMIAYIFLQKSGTKIKNVLFFFFFVQS